MVTATLNPIAHHSYTRKDNMFDISAFYKAVGGGVAGLLIAEAARFGFNPDAPTKDALALVVTALVGYIVGHVIVYFSPKNK